MGTKERKTREREELRLKILLSAADLITESGIENLSIRKLASSIDYSPRTIYLYFRDKDDILYHIVEHGFTVTLNALEQLNRELPPGAGGDCFYVLEKMLRRHVAVALSSPNHYRVVFEVLQKSRFSPGPAQRQIEKHVFENIASCLGFDPEQISAGDAAAVDDLVFLVFSVLRGFTISLINSGYSSDPEMAERRTGLFIGFVLNSLDNHNIKLRG